MLQITTVNAGTLGQPLGKTYLEYSCRHPTSQTLSKHIFNALRHVEAGGPSDVDRAVDRVTYELIMDTINILLKFTREERMVSYRFERMLDVAPLSGGNAMEDWTSLPKGLPPLVVFEQPQSPSVINFLDTAASLPAADRAATLAVWMQGEWLLASDGTDSHVPPNAASAISHYELPENLNITAMHVARNAVAMVHHDLAAKLIAEANSVGTQRTNKTVLDTAESITLIVESPAGLADVGSPHLITKGKVVKVCGNDEENLQAFIAPTARNLSVCDDDVLQTKLNEAVKSNGLSLDVDKFRGRRISAASCELENGEWCALLIYHLKHPGSKSDRWPEDCAAMLNVYYGIMQDLYPGALVVLSGDSNLATVDESNAAAAILHKQWGLSFGNATPTLPSLKRDGLGLNFEATSERGRSIIGSGQFKKCGFDGVGILETSAKIGFVVKTANTDLKTDPPPYSYKAVVHNAEKGTPSVALPLDHRNASLYVYPKASTLSKSACLVLLFSAVFTFCALLMAVTQAPHSS